MKQCSKCKVSKEGSLFNRDKSCKDGLYPYCKECSQALRRESYARTVDPIARRAKSAKWRADNTDRARELNRAAHQSNKAKRNAASKQYRVENKEKTQALCRQWAKDNLDKMRVTNAERRAKKKNAIPSWASDEFDKLVVAESYDLAKLRTVATGQPWHVDHVVPLRNERVCGLHCAANLQVITAVANHVKGNRVWPDM